MKSIITLLLFCLPFWCHSQISYADSALTAGLYGQAGNYSVAVGDYNNDGWEDVYLSRTTGANQLFKNNGDGTFTDVSLPSSAFYFGPTRASVWADFDNDGWLDLFLANEDGYDDVLFHNNANGTFTDISTSAGIAFTGNVQAAIAGDVNNDGYLDIYIAHFGKPNVLWRNNGDLTFTDYTLGSGTRDSLASMGAVFFDYDNDNDIDLYLVHDGYDPNILYENDGTGHFTNVAPQSNTDVAAMGMGVDFGDINNDGWFDIYIANLGYNDLFLNNQDGTFTNIRDSSGANDGFMGWGTSFLDANNDGFHDIYVTNMAGAANVMYQNMGDNTFNVVSNNNVLGTDGVTFGMATMDYNNDGLLDLMVPSTQSTPGNQLLVNNTLTNNNWIKIETVGTVSNRNGVGARVEVFGENGFYNVDQVTAGSGWCSQNSLYIHFGLGTITTIDSVVVTWTSGIKDVHRNLAMNTKHIVTEGTSTNTNKILAEENIFSLKTYPNPIQTNLNITYDLKAAGKTMISVWNIDGKLVEIISKQTQSKGEHQLTWTPNSKLSNGLYFVRVENEGEMMVQPVVVSR